MKLNGALEPQQGASNKRSSIGAKQYCYKQCENESNNIVALNGVSFLGNCSSVSCNNIENNNNKNNKNNNSKIVVLMKNNIKKIIQTSKNTKEINSMNDIFDNNSKATIDIDIDTDIELVKKNNNTNKYSNNNNNNKIYNNNTNNHNHNSFKKEKNWSRRILESFSDLHQENSKSLITTKSIINNIKMELNEKEDEEDRIPTSEHVKKTIKISNKYNYKNHQAGNRTNHNNSYNTMSIKNVTKAIFFSAISMLSSFGFNYLVSLAAFWYQAFHIDMNLKAMMRVLEPLQALIIGTTTKATTTEKKTIAMKDFNWTTTRTICCLIALLSLPCRATCDDNFFAVNSFSMEPETTTPQFDYASRGQKKFGDKCENTLECGFPGSICDPKKKSCQCTEDLPVTNHIDKCGKEAAVNESCFFNEQCEVKHFQTECRDGRCVCRFEMTPFWDKDGTVECKGRGDKKGPETYIDPAMIGVLVGMALMFVIICVVLRLFSQARWRENRTIFNTPNPRLMNVSLLRESKLLHGQERRGSRMSVRGPSRQPSMASLRPHSPNPSLGKTGSRSNSHGSNASATSIRSTRSNSVAPGNVTANGQHEQKNHANTQQPQQHPQHQQHSHQQHPHHQQQSTNITTNPVAENVTVEIIEPEQ